MDAAPFSCYNAKSAIQHKLYRHNVGSLMQHTTFLQTLEGGNFYTTSEYTSTAQQPAPDNPYAMNSKGPSLYEEGQSSSIITQEMERLASTVSLIAHDELQKLAEEAVAGVSLASSGSSHASLANMVAAPPPEAAVGAIMHMSARLPTDNILAPAAAAATAASSNSATKPKRKRSRNSRKNSEEMEHQRRTHIAVERNRRKQMNDNLSTLRSLMPTSYVQRGDQASIVGGAIQFVRELEQLLYFLRVQKQLQVAARDYIAPNDVNWMQVRQAEDYINNYDNYQISDDLDKGGTGGYGDGDDENEDSCARHHVYAESKSATAGVEVRMLERGCFAQVEVLARKVRGLLSRSLASMNQLQLVVLHLNITSIGQAVLYSFHLQMRADCQVGLASKLAESMQRIFSVHSCTATDVHIPP